MKKLAAIVLSTLLAVAGMISASAVSTLADRSKNPAEQGAFGQKIPAVDDTQPVSGTVSENVPTGEMEPAETQLEVMTAEESATGTSGMVQDDGNTSTVWVITSVVAAVVVIGGVIAAVVVKKKKR